MTARPEQRVSLQPLSIYWLKYVPFSTEFASLLLTPNRLKPNACAVVPLSAGWGKPIVSHAVTGRCAFSRHTVTAATQTDRWTLGERTGGCQIAGHNTVGLERPKRLWDPQRWKKRHLCWSFAWVYCTTSRLLFAVKWMRSRRIQMLL